MSRKKLLLDNFLIYGFGRVAGKIIPFLFLPLITRLLPDTSVYGVYDLFKVVSVLTTVIVGMGLGDALFRFYFDSEDEHHRMSVCSSVLIITTISGGVIFIIFVIFSKQISTLIFNDASYYWVSYLIGLFVFTDSVKKILMTPFRANNQRKKIIVISWLTPLLIYSISILLVIYWLPLPALILGSVFSPFVVLFISLYYNHKYFSLKLFDKSLVVPLLKYGLPLIPAFVIYWVFQSLDRLMISNFLGTSAVGVYAIGAKFGALSQLVTSAFSQGYQHFLFSTMNYKDRIEKNSKLVEYFFLLVTISFIIVNPFIKSIYLFVFSEEYSQGYHIAPYLFLSPFFLILYQLIASQNTIEKNTLLSTSLLIPGLLSNIILNAIFIPILGIIGAAISTLTGYFVSLLIALIVTSKRNLIAIPLKVVIICFITIITISIFNYYIDLIFWRISVSIFFGIVICIFQHKSIKKLIITLINK